MPTPLPRRIRAEREEPEEQKSAGFSRRGSGGGARPGGYAGRFHKVKRSVKVGFFGAVDYALLQINVPAAGLGTRFLPDTMIVYSL